MKHLLPLAALLLALPARAAEVTCGNGDATAMLNAALAAGGEVRIAAGTCLVSASVLVRSQTTLVGAGMGHTVIRTVPGATWPVLAIGGRTLAEGSQDVEVSGLSVEGGATAVAARDGGERPDGIRVPFGSTRVRIHHVEVSGAAANGVEINGSDNEVRDSAVHDNFQNGIYVTGKGNRGGLNVVAAHGVRVIGNTVAHNSLGKPAGSGHAWDGIDIDPITEGALVERNTVQRNDIILFENGNVVPYSRGHRVIGNTVQDSPGNGIVVEGPQADFTIADNRIERIVGWGIVTNGPSRGGMLRGNHISGTTREGILVKNTTPQRGAPEDIAIIGNEVVVGPSGPARIGLAARHGARGLRIEGNTFPGAPSPEAAMDLRFAGPPAVGAPP